MTTKEKMKAIRSPFQITMSGGVAKSRGYNDIVRGQIIDALMTNQGERVMRPRHGCDILASVFDPSDELVRRDAASFIKQRLTQFVQRALITKVTVNLGSSLGRGGESSGPWVSNDAIGQVDIRVSYRPSLYATDTEIEIPVSSEFLRRQIAIQAEGLPT